MGSDAVVKDRESGAYIRSTEIALQEYFKVPGIAITEPSPQRTPVISAAGASKR